MNKNGALVRKTGSVDMLRYLREIEMDQARQILPGIRLKY